MLVRLFVDFSVSAELHPAALACGESMSLGVVVMGLLEVWVDVFHCELFVVETARCDYGPAFLWGQLYLEV